MLPMFLAGPDCSLQFSDPTETPRAKIDSRDIPTGGGCQARSIPSRLLWQPSKTWHCTQRHLPRLRGIEFWPSIRRREDFRVAQFVAWKVTNSNDGSMTSTRGIHEVTAPNFEDRQAPRFRRPWIPGADRGMTCPRDIDIRSCWRHEHQPLRR